MVGFLRKTFEKARGKAGRFMKLEWRHICSLYPWWLLVTLLWFEKEGQKAHTDALFLVSTATLTLFAHTDLLQRIIYIYNNVSFDTD